MRAGIRISRRATDPFPSRTRRARPPSFCVRAAVWSAEPEQARRERRGPPDARTLRIMRASRHASFLFAAIILGCGAPPARVLSPPGASPPSSRDVVMALAAYDQVVPADPSCASVAEADATLEA